LLGVNGFASTGVLVNSLNPQRMSFDRRESSSVLSVSGFCGTSHAVTIVVRAGISGPTSGTPDDVVGTGVREQPAATATSISAQAFRVVELMATPLSG
jgi:hypothetical protein